MARKRSFDGWFLVGSSRYLAVFLKDEVFFLFCGLMLDYLTSKRCFLHLGVKVEAWKNGRANERGIFGCKRFKEEEKTKKNSDRKE